MEPLIAVLRDEDSRGHGEAARALGIIGDPQAVEPLITALKDERVREKAEEALDEIGTPEARCTREGGTLMLLLGGAALSKPKRHIPHLLDALCSGLAFPKRPLATHRLYPCAKVIDKIFFIEGGRGR